MTRAAHLAVVLGGGWSYHASKSCGFNIVSYINCCHTCIAVDPGLRRSICQSLLLASSVGLHTGIAITGSHLVFHYDLYCKEEVAGLISTIEESKHPPQYPVLFRTQGPELLSG